MEVILEEMKFQERSLRRDAWVVNSKVNALESLLNRKERQNQRLSKRLKDLQEEIGALRLAEREFKQNNPFKEKAMQMFEALSKSKRENQVLEKTIQDLMRKNALSTQDEGFSDADRTAMARNLEDLTKKLDRANRALEAEKAKSAQL